MTVGEFLKETASPYDAVTVRKEATLRQILDVMLRRREEREVFVVDNDGAVVGVIALGALARHIMHEGIAPQNGFSPSTDILHYLTAENAGDIMEPGVAFCTKDESLDAALQKMLGPKVYKVLPVVDEGRRIVAVLDLITLLESVLDDA